MVVIKTQPVRIPTPHTPANVMLGGLETDLVVKVIVCIVVLIKRQQDDTQSSVLSFYF